MTIFTGKIPTMKPPLRLQGQVNINTKERIEDSIKGVDYSFTYTGRRQALKSPVIDSYYFHHKRLGTAKVRQESLVHGPFRKMEAVYRKSCKAAPYGYWYCPLLVMRMMRNFEVTKSNFQEWDKYKPTHFPGL